MNSRRAAIYAFQLALSPAPIVAGQSLPLRQGWLLELEQDGRQGYGECSPLPGFSIESLQQSFEALQQQAQHWLNGQPIEVDSASARFAASCAREELAQGPLYGPLADALCQPLLTDPQQTSDAALVKLKLGRRDLGEEIRWVKRLIDNNPAIQLRIDCNRHWQLEQGQQFLQSVPVQAIDYLEEPCQTLEASLQLCHQFDVGLALDESLTLPGSSLPLSSQLKALVLKPSQIGSIEQLQSWITRGQQRNLQTVLSSSYETSLGLGQIAALSARYCPDQATGLDTAGCFTAGLLRPWPATSSSPRALLSLSELECRWHS